MDVCGCLDFVDLNPLGHPALQFAAHCSSFVCLNRLSVSVKSEAGINGGMVAASRHSQVAICGVYLYSTI